MYDAIVFTYFFQYFMIYAKFNSLEKEKSISYEKS